MTQNCQQRQIRRRRRNDPQKENFYDYIAERMTQDRDSSSQDQYQGYNRLKYGQKKDLAINQLLGIGSEQDCTSHHSLYIE